MKRYYAMNYCDICNSESENNHIDKLKIYSKSKIRIILMWFFKIYILEDDTKKLYLCKKCVSKFNKAMYNKNVLGDFSPSDTHNIG